MAYGESAFDIIYLALAVFCGIRVLLKAQNRTEKYMGLAVLILGLGDAFHLIPRVLNYFTDSDLTPALGTGKLVTSLTMTVFYVMMYRIYVGHYGVKENGGLSAAVYALTVLRFVLCALAQNNWLQNESSVTWGIIRNLPFVALGTIIVALYFKKRNETGRFRFIWLYVALSFIFYIPVAVAAGLLPILGMLMLPKTVCYILIILTFYNHVVREKKA
ncbi:MAG: hypothetical protein IKS19_04865 [Clostridia bacterium]|nr:hypothetical protein [Clostridia bacterium]